MKTLIATAALAAILFTVGQVAFAGEQDGPVFDPRPAPTYQTEQATQILSSGDEEQRPLHPDVRG